MTSEKATALEQLQLAIHGVAAPFACEGTVVPDDAVSLLFKDGTRFQIVRAENSLRQKGALEPLLKRCESAPFGDGKKTRYDRKVRDALQLKAEHGAFSVENFDPRSSGILQEIQQELVPHDPNPVSAELYSLNVYTAGGHFKSHKDTPRGEDMFGTLVVCLPSQFFRGDLVLTHRGVVRNFPWGNAIHQQKTPNQLHWAAFFGDVDHRIDKILDGARVTLTYLLRRGKGGAPLARDGESVAPRVQEAWQALLADESFMPEGGTLAYPCCHLYHQDARFQVKQRPLTPQSAGNLKGRDHLVAATALGSKLNVTFNAYMFEDCADESWQLDRFPTSQEKAKLGRQLDSVRLKSALPIRASSEDEGDFGITWLEDPPSTGSNDSSGGDQDAELPAAARLHHADYCPWGYFGNESSEVDFYIFAALHIEVPPAGERPLAAVRSSTAVKRRQPVRKGRAKTAEKKRAVRDS
jgi:hypothetical protein